MMPMSANSSPECRAEPGGAAQHRQAGFSLLEVLAALVIVGFSASIIGLNVDRSIASAQRRQALSEVARLIDQARIASLVRASPVMLQSWMEHNQTFAGRDDIDVRFSELARIHALGACESATVDVRYKNREFVLTIAPVSCRVAPA